MSAIKVNMTTRPIGASAEGRGPLFPSKIIIDALKENVADHGLDDAMIGASTLVGAVFRFVIDAAGHDAALKLLGELDDALSTAIASERAAAPQRPN